MNDPHRQLMQQVAEGNHTAFRRLARELSPSLHAVAWRMLGQSGHAEDALQEALLKLWQTAPQWRGDAKVSTWAYRITVNACQDIWRRQRKPTVPLEDIEEPAMNPTAPAQVHTRQRRAILGNALKGLPENQRTAIILTYMHDLPQVEVATILRLSTRAVEGLLHRARAHLRTRLDEKDLTANLEEGEA